jgi:hypothetical protein
MRNHGRISCYNAGCRCRECQRTAAAYRRRYRERTGDLVRSDGHVYPLRFCLFCDEGFYYLGQHEDRCAVESGERRPSALTRVAGGGHLAVLSPPAPAPDACHSPAVG